MTEQNHPHRESDSMEKGATRLPYTDHDLLIRIDAQLEWMGKDFTAYKLETSGNITRLWQEKASVGNFSAYQEEHRRTHEKLTEDSTAWEARLRKVENRLLWFGGLLFGLQIAAEVAIRVIWK